jgi:hypothetical protein
MRLILFGFLLAAAFGGGYVIGGREHHLVQQNLERLQAEMGEKAAELEHRVREARVRGQLAEMREALTTAQGHIEHQDFGLARSTLADARRSLQFAMGLDERGAIDRLKPLDQEIERIAGAAVKLGPRAIDEIEQIKQQIPPAP